MPPEDPEEGRTEGREDRPDRKGKGIEENSKRKWIVEDKK